jgi:hypothetical protein
VKLRDDGADTVLNYSARAEVGGKLASVGSRLVEGVAKKTADDFFGKFSQIVGAGGGAAAPAPQTQQGAPTQGSVLGDGPGEREQPAAVSPAQNVGEAAQVQQSAAAAPLGMASSASAAGPATHGSSAAAAPVSTPNATGGLSPWVWGVGLVVIVGVLWYAFGR